KIPVHFNIGHLVTAHGDTRSPRGDYLIAMNKLSKGRHLSVGPSIPESSQLIGLDGGRKMTMLYEAFTEPEPHFAQLVHRDVLKPIEFYPRAESHHRSAIWNPADARVTRTGNRVEGTVYAIRTYFEPGRIQVQQGDTVTLHITNAEPQRDELHGFAVVAHDKNIIIDPGETKTVKFVADRAGVFPFYCTNFCSALHQEMQGYLEVVPRGRRLAMYDGAGQGEMRFDRRKPQLAMAGHGHH
ncbi:MAG TPA: cupredoxin domain-containing protein, partial [Longimicrobiaceae bacterium]|nr:cupredoxin domain-containing protein [Longimicrobiaceae bacterium]